VLSDESSESDEKSDKTPFICSNTNCMFANKITAYDEFLRGYREVCACQTSECPDCQGMSPSIGEFCDKCKGYGRLVE